jgi:glutamyl-tRNA synthetase
MGQIGPAVRLALSGSTVSPGIYEMLEVLGKAESRKRLERAIASIG